MVLASDALHFTENRVRRNPFPILVDVRECLAGFETCESLADRDDLIVPGHDPAVAPDGASVTDLVGRGT
ncbi:hypothetical protein I4I73_29405 [Pseudonocardia sp. KRD-184]|uniref:Metallo-beta-lactamase superfamily protein n=1 Tax=Pseudonocardia oceani TaxID=2792013 RepID=A0ABS6UCG3_9PSEU|nr:hypothetical protein [Pseudonocardia oceani]MBW0093374.1 hypothetical protein [Pseudonocardia oceani]MBW0100103.1 hypothetical protein [Pseudonocardia oceani]MBW0112788.1 hypothetical protein [Pseudonocardia oceani]MBW0121239.1 hypothetical protein [Pseudonocardia oceani]MBW0129931.1 hypothetical protein [Pseudonocardia oceani]